MHVEYLKVAHAFACLRSRYDEAAIVMPSNSFSVSMDGLLEAVAAFQPKAADALSDEVCTCRCAALGVAGVVL